MKARPIIFSADMVRAILAGKKTQTRRVVKDAYVLDIAENHPHIIPDLGTNCEDGTFGFEYVEYGAICGEEHLWEPKDTVWQEVKCPYGVVGDQLWVREGYRQELNLGYDKDGNWPDTKGMFSYFYKADCSNPEGWGAGVWKSPLFMPRAASRILLEITAIRVERVQDISEADARSEGITDGGCLSCGNPEPCECSNPKPDARESYIWLWDQINGKKHPWSDNPWVWVVEFKRVEHSHD